MNNLREEKEPVQTVEACWCGSKQLAPAAHPSYLVCRWCGTAKLRAELLAGQDPVRDEQSHIYGEAYWNDRQVQLGLTPIEARARTDLVELVPYWLSYLFQYSLPPGRALEIGCSHGGLLKCLELAGYESLGIEMSPSVIARARQWFGVEVLQGPLESIGDPLGEFDLVAMFDVLEHLANPLTTLEAVARHIPEEGLIAVQTPELNDRRGADWQMHLVPEHTFLFTRGGMEKLLRQCGFTYVLFQPHVLFQDNMLVFASRIPLRANPPERIDAALLATPGGRIVRGLLDQLPRTFGRGIVLGLLDQLPRTFGQDRLFNAVMNGLRDGRDWPDILGTRRLTVWFARSLWRSLARWLRF
jgi:2-polyprenyl-3-methyl-5-hydroxy-6-metoxy-1,4-benzoquinol methylase